MHRLILALLVTFPVSGAITTSAITGRVTVGKGPGAGVLVTATSAAIPHPRTTTTSPQGRYWLGALPPGAYEVTFTRDGATSYTRRAYVELARVARADAALELSEDEESVSSTVKSVGVGETQAITTAYSDRTIDSLPVRRDPRSVADLPSSVAPQILADDGPASQAELFGQEIFEDVTVLRGAIPVEYEATPVQTILVARTRSGDRTFLSLRDTMSNRSWTSNRGFTSGSGLQHFVEAAAGGRIVRDRLWLFGAAWRGEERWQRTSDTHGFHFKATAQPGVTHSVMASYLEGSRDSSLPLQSSLGVLHYTAIPTSHVVVEGQITRSTIRFPSAGPSSPEPFARDEGLLLKTSFFLPTAYGDHVVTAGSQLNRLHGLNTSTSGNALFVNDRWMIHRWIINAGARRDSGGNGLARLRPRLSLAYDLNGNGRQSLIATHSSYHEDSGQSDSMSESTLGFITAIGTSGHIRADAIRRIQSNGRLFLAELEAGYRLFDRFAFGAQSTLASRRDAGSEQHIRAWASAAFPLGEHELGVTLLQRYRHLSSANLFPTDLALRYTVPLASVAVTGALDVVDVLNESGTRAARVWVRLRL